MATNISSRAATSIPGILRSPHLLLFLAMVFLAGNFVVARGIYQQCPPSVLSMWRWGGAALILLPFAWPGIRGNWRTMCRSWVVLVSCAVLITVIGGQVGYLAMARTMAVNGAIVQSMIPVFIVLLSGVLLIDRIDGRKALGLAVSMAGVLGIISRGDPEVLLGLRFNTGDLILLLSGCGIAGYSVLVKRSLVRIPPLPFLAVICAVGAILHIPFVAFEMAHGSVMTFNTATVLSILYVAIFPTVLTMTFYNYGIEKLGPNKAGVYMYLMPVIAAVLAYLVLGEVIRMYHVIGTIVIVVGIYLTVRERPRPASTRD